jgi:hypothetical protein
MTATQLGAAPVVPVLTARHKRLARMLSEPKVGARVGQPAADQDDFWKIHQLLCGDPPI